MKSRAIRVTVIALVTVSVAANAYLFFRYRHREMDRGNALAMLASDTPGYLGYADSYIQSTIAGGFKSYALLSQADPYLRAAANAMHQLQYLDSGRGQQWTDMRAAVDGARFAITRDQLNVPPEWDSLSPDAAEKLQAVSHLISDLQKAFPEQVSLGQHPRAPFDSDRIEAARAAALDYLKGPPVSLPDDTATLPMEGGAEGGVPPEVSSLFADYGCTVSAFLGSFQATLPESLVTNVEDPPAKLYWMRAKALSDDIGYHLEDNLGKAVTIELYRVGEAPEGFASSVTRGVVLRGTDGRVVGAYIDTGRHAGASYTLSGRDLEDIAGIAGYGVKDYWRDHYLDDGDPVNIAAAGRTAEEVIKRYFEGMTTGNAAMQLSTLSVDRKMNSLYVNLDDGLPFNDPPTLYAYLDGAEILSIEPYDEPYDAGDPDGLQGYAVRMNARVSERSVLEDGVQMRFVTIGEENGMLRIFGDGTGP